MTFAAPGDEIHAKGILHLIQVAWKDLDEKAGTSLAGSFQGRFETGRGIYGFRFQPQLPLVQPFFGIAKLRVARKRSQPIRTASTFRQQQNTLAPAIHPVLAST
ncbi:hypothetical protein [Albidovulum inexpectatum]|uniref:hypothetical protein n=1 Tax=Albidovulum inexpectatum TaxID=196587 RepID=UPI00147564CC